MSRLSVLFLLLVASACAFAQPHSWTYASLEAILSQGDTVFTGHIFSDDLVGNNSEAPERELTIQVDEVLKGKPGKTVALRHDANGITRWVPDYLGPNTKLLWVVKAGPPQVWTVLDIRDTKATFNGLPSFPRLPILSYELKQIRRSSDTLSLARHFLASIHSTPPLRLMTIPRDISGQSRPDTATQSFMAMMSEHATDDSPGVLGEKVLLPVVPALEGIARKMIEDPASFLPPVAPIAGTKVDVKVLESLHKFAMDDVRIVGIKLLADFKSERNEKLLEPLLADETIRGFARPGEIGESKGREYAIRHVAFDVLAAWGSKVEKPVIVLPDSG